MSVTLRQLAEAAGVSTATVSKILNKTNHHISLETQKKVEDLAKQYGYQANSIAKGLRLKKTRTLGFVLPDITNPFFPDIAKGVEDAAAQAGYGVLYCNTNNDEKREEACLAILKSRMVDGIIFTQALSTHRGKILLDMGIPTVIVDRVGIDVNGVGKIYIDTNEAFYKSTKRLIQAGCATIAFISAQSASMNDRLNGYQSALINSSIDPDPALLYLQNYDVQTGYMGIQSILAKNTVDGVVCGNDLIALGVLRCLKEYRLSVPSQVKVIGFDDIYISQFLSPPLTTIHQPSYEYGFQAVTMLMDALEYDKPLYNKQLSYELIERGTV